MHPHGKRNQKDPVCQVVRKSLSVLFHFFASLDLDESDLFDPTRPASRTT
jgi:hypothetical protein